MYLNCKTYYSFRYGTYSIEQLVKEAEEKGIKALTLTNINTTCDEWEFVKTCNTHGIKPIIGVEIKNDDTLLYILIAANNKGLTWIHRFLSDRLLNKIDFPQHTEVAGFFDTPADGFVLFPLGAKPLETLRQNEYIGIRAAELHALYTINWKPYRDKFVIRQPVTIQNKTYYSLHRLLRAIDKNTLLSKLPGHSQALPDEIFLSPSELLEKFSAYPSFITNTCQLIDRCHIELNMDEDKTKQTYGASKEEDSFLLQKLAWDGFYNRYDKNNAAAKERVKKELGIINKLGFNSYFLINWDIVVYAQSCGFYHVGRGSGANSIVAYCLKITDVDPIELNLYFERFLNDERTSPPDFDIDFSWTDRDAIMEYVFKRYGKNHVALLGSFSTFKHDASILQLGKVFGLPAAEIKTLQRTGIALDPIQRLILQYSKLLKGFPNIMSLHSCGMLVSDKPIYEHVSLFMPPKGFPTAQIDMFIAEAIGLNKFDVLSQRGLGHIRDCLQLVKKNKGIHINIHAFDEFKTDEKIKEKIRTADTIGCFYIESPAMRGLLKKLCCDDYLTLVAASSIIRPGVAESGMMREYIYRYHNRDAIQYPHPLFKEHLSETFGVMVYQEDVIKIAHYFAELSLAEADVLRRAMSGKYRSNNEFLLIKEKFMHNCERIGHSKELAEEVWRQMQSFAGYSFNKAHSASYAVESYMSLYLKTYYPREFMVAVINNFGGFYSRELYFLELLKSGGTICPPCINKSDLYTIIINDTVYAGFIHIKGLQDKFITDILEERKTNGSYLHLQDFIERVHPGLEQLNTLISIGAFSFTTKSKKRLLWEANFLQKKVVRQPAALMEIFKETPVEFELPELTDEPVDDLYDQIEILGFPLTNPFKLVNDDPSQYVASKEMHLYKGKSITVLAYFIARKHVTTKYKDTMFFGTFVDSNLDWVDTVHFPESAKRFPFENGFYRIQGKVVEDFGVCTMEVNYMKPVAYKTRSYAHL